MKYLLFSLLLTVGLVSCFKEDEMAPATFKIDGYWNVKRDTTFTGISANANYDLYHLFKSPNVYFRLSFLKTFDFSVTTAMPKDTVNSLFLVDGNMLMTPNPAPSASNVVPGSVLYKQYTDSLIFTRFIIMKRDPITAQPTKTRTDTIKYYRVTDPVKIAYFNNYIAKRVPAN